MTTPCAPAPSCCSVFCQTEWQWCFQKPLCFVLKHRIHIHIQLRPYNTADRSTAASREPRAARREAEAARGARREAVPRGRGRGRGRQEAGDARAATPPHRPAASRAVGRWTQPGASSSSARRAATTAWLAVVATVSRFAYIGPSNGPGPGTSYVHGGSPPDLVWVA
jgi:hypothetical protein